jgi:hypothetical protein
MKEKDRGLNRDAEELENRASIGRFLNKTVLSGECLAAGGFFAGIFFSNLESSKILLEFSKISAAAYLGFATIHFVNKKELEITKKLAKNQGLPVEETRWGPKIKRTQTI